MNQDLLQLIELLNGTSEHWYKYFFNILEKYKLDKNTDDLSHSILNAFGGMGSFSDFIYSLDDKELSMIADKIYKQAKESSIK